MLDYNLTDKKTKKYLFAWSPFNDKQVTDPHKPLDTIILISKTTDVVKAFTYLEFRETFESIKKR